MWGFVNEMDLNLNIVFICNNFDIFGIQWGWGGGGGGLKMFLGFLI